MKTLAILAQKGGTGKTTLAVHLAVLAVQEGKRTMLVDTDPQRSAGDWWRARAPNLSATLELAEVDADDLRALVRTARVVEDQGGANLVIIDTAPHAEASAVTAAAKAADLVLIPCRPGILDLRAIWATVELVRKARRKAAIVLNGCPPPRGLGEAGLTYEARQGLAGYRLPVAPVALSQRVAFSHALIDGRAVTEFEPQGKAAGELRRLWSWIEGEF